MGCGLQLFDPAGTLYFDSNTNRPAQVLDLVIFTTDTVITDARIVDDGATYFAKQINTGVNAAGTRLHAATSFNTTTHQLAISVSVRANYTGSGPSVTPMAILYGKII